MSCDLSHIHKKLCDPNTPLIVFSACCVCFTTYGKVICVRFHPDGMVASTGASGPYVCWDLSRLGAKRYQMPIVEQNDGDLNRRSGTFEFDEVWGR